MPLTEVTNPHHSSPAGDLFARVNFFRSLFPELGLIQKRFLRSADVREFQVPERNSPQHLGLRRLCDIRLRRCGGRLQPRSEAISFGSEAFSSLEIQKRHLDIKAKWSNFGRFVVCEFDEVVWWAEPEGHGYASPVDGTAMALKAGTDMDCGDWGKKACKMPTLSPYSYDRVFDRCPHLS